MEKVAEQFTLTTSIFIRKYLGTVFVKKKVMYKKLLVIAMAGILFLACSAKSDTAPTVPTTQADEKVKEYEGYKLVWNDEFNNTETLDLNKWHLQIKPITNGGWANGELQHYTDRKDNVYVSNGTLKIKAKRETYEYENSSRDFTSARLNSKFDFQYGRIDVYAKLPSQQGAWPAIWTLGSNINERGNFFGDTRGSVGWPACGEIDLMEKRGNQNDRVLGTFHWQTPADSKYASFTKDKIVDNLIGQFHLYSLIWNSGILKIYVDDMLVIEMRNATFKNPHYILLNVAVGGSLGGQVPSSFQEAIMEIDYVRVYQGI